MCIVPRDGIRTGGEGSEALGNRHYHWQGRRKPRAEQQVQKVKWKLQLLSTKHPRRKLEAGASRKRQWGVLCWASQGTRASIGGEGQLTGLGSLCFRHFPSPHDAPNDIHVPWCCVRMFPEERRVQRLLLLLPKVESSSSHSVPMVTKAAPSSSLYTLPTSL